MNRTYSKPYYCHKCGNPYPWTQQIIDNAVEILSIDGEVDDEIKKNRENEKKDIMRMRIMSFLFVGLLMP